MSAIATSAPARASVSASARPSPREPPVTKATRPDRSISIGTRQEYFRCDHEPLDLRGALVDLKQLRVAHELLDRVLLDVAVAAEHLHRIGRDLHRRIGGEALRERRVQRRLAPEPLIEHPGGLPAEESRCPILSRCCSMVTPGAFIGTMNADMPFAPTLGSVFAKTTVHAA